jgi:hypothetical protein
MRARYARASDPGGRSTIGRRWRLVWVIAGGVQADHLARAYLLNGTRGRSRTCVLWVQSPTGMPATHGSCIGSGGRNRTCLGCVLQRCWDASNPHLNEIGGPVRSCTLLPGFGDPYLATRTDPNWRSAVSPSHMPQATRSAFQTAPGPCRVHAPRLAEGGRSRSTHPQRCHSFSKRGCAPRTSPSNVGRG